ncbi:unnamed protein product [Rotaria sp. Silwood1]|nr:unnamed protein product [Rotaria sp. Silwood1]CAF1619865.1 unnamed protein product [Rotaria sp. Silwood1]
MSTLKLPSPILSISSSDLFDLIRSHCGQEVLDIVIAQKIPDIQTLLRVNDLFTLVYLPTNEFRELKEKVAVQLHDGTWSVLIGFQARVDELMNALREQARLDENEYYPSSNITSTSDHLTLSIELLNKFPALSSLIKLCTDIHTLSDRNDLTLLIEILNNICTNLTRSKNNFQYSDYIMKFAILLFIYSGQNAYRFVSLNVPGFLPSITTIKKRLANSSFRMYEAHFRFDAMHDYFSSNGFTFAFAAEDATGVISKVTYDSMSNSFIGFDTPLAHGQPLPDQHRTDSYVELQKWFEEKQTSSFINVHMLQPLLNTSSGQIPSPFLLSAYGIAGTYTAEDVLNRWLWIYEETKKKGIRIIGFSTDCDSRYLRKQEYSSGLRFPKHHKHGKVTRGPSSSSSSSTFTYSSLRPVDIETIVEEAFATAYELIEPLIGKDTLQTSKYKTTASLSKLIIKHYETSKLKSRSSQLQQVFDDPSKEINNEDEDEEDEDEEDEDEEDKDEEQDLSHVLLDSSNVSFRGMRVKESIDPKQSDSFFKVRRENDTTDVYIHKQTACWVLTNEKSSLSSDRLKRVTQSK